MQSHQQRHAALRALARLGLAALIVAPGLALAQADGGLAQTTCGFLSKIKDVLNAVSIVVVTIAVIFSGYQIAFAHKRIGDIAPVFIGALLIGAAGQIAKLFLSDTSGNGCQSSAAFNFEQLQHVAGLLQSFATLHA
ncbi:MAG: TrbC/VirB2 family protein [Proteobacteria bacterium]|nr:TrbC/VirB2 family protein [Pseudomonadota bacterium]